MSVVDKINSFKNAIKDYNCKLVAISKTKPNSMILEAYHGGHRIFGENKVQDLVAKYEDLPKDIEWHYVGHLQTNKVRFIAPFIQLIQAVDSLKLLKEINKQAIKNNRIIQCLLQVHIAREKTKFGLSEEELKSILGSHDFKSLKNVKIIGLMGMATFTNDMDLVRSEFRNLKRIFNEVSVHFHMPAIQMKELSMGMTDDYQVAIEEGSTMIRIGTAIFGERNY